MSHTDMTLIDPKTSFIHAGFIVFLIFLTFLQNWGGSQMIFSLFFGVIPFFVPPPLFHFQRDFERSFHISLYFVCVIYYFSPFFL